MSNNRPPFIQTYWFKLTLGLILMLVGMYGSNQHWGTLAIIEEKGIPLDLMKTVAVIGVFMILFPVMNYFYLAPLAESINNRTKSLEDTFSEAESLRADMESMKADYTAQLAETEASAREQIQGEIKKAQDLRKQLETDAAANADALLKKAQAEIAAERDRALLDLRVHVATLSLLATEMILEENMDNERNRKLIDDFVDQVEVPNA